METMSILVLLTSHDRLGDTGEKTGFWLEEFAAPYYVFKDAGAKVTLSSPKGGQAPIDPKSAMAEWQTEATHRLNDDREAMLALKATRRLSDVFADDYDALFVPGGHGPMWDYPDDHDLARLVAAFDQAGKPIGAVCHGPAALVSAHAGGGAPLLKGRRATGFTNTEEEAVGLTKVVPFLLEDRMRALGSAFLRGPDFAPYVVRDQNLVTGQNPASSAPAAEVILEALRDRPAR